MEKMKKNKKRYIIVLVVGIIIGIIIGTFYNQLCKKKESNVNSNMENVINEDIYIKTKYGVLHYPKAWQDKLFTSIKADDGNYTVIFNANVLDEKVELFEIIFSSEQNCENCYLIGKINDSDNNSINVFMHPIEFKPDENFTEKKDIDTVYAMQDEVNYVVEHLGEIQNFEAIH